MQILCKPWLEIYDCELSNYLLLINPRLLVIYPIISYLSIDPFFISHICSMKIGFSCDFLEKKKHEKKHDFLEKKSCCHYLPVIVAHPQVLHLPVTHPRPELSHNGSSGSGSSRGVSDRQALAEPPRERCHGSAGGSSTAGNHGAIG